MHGCTGAVLPSSGFVVSRRRRRQQLLVAGSFTVDVVARKRARRERAGASTRGRKIGASVEDRYTAWKGGPRGRCGGGPEEHAKSRLLN